MLLSLSHESPISLLKRHLQSLQ
jgi:hypothetical protein